MTASTAQRRLETSDRISVLIGVFFSFMPVGLFAMTIAQESGNWFAIGLISVYTGLNSVAWASAFVLRRLWILIPLVPAQYLIPRYGFKWLGNHGWFDGSTGLTPTGTRLVLVIMGVLSMVIGYILVMRLARRFERRGVTAQAELDVASKIHKTLVPDLDLRTGRVRVLGSSVPSSTMGGDLIDAVRSPDGRVDVLLADVSGHGVGAGIVMGMVKASARTLLASVPPLGRYLTHLNRVLCELTSADMFATAACVRVYETEHSSQIAFALAGHHPILLRRASGEVVELPNDALPLGISPDEKVTEGTIACELGDTLLLLTDGLIEVQNSAGRELGFATLRGVFQQHGGAPLEQLRELLFQTAQTHGRAHDDQSVILIRIG